MKNEFLQYLKKAVKGATTLIRSIDDTDLDWTPTYGGRSVLEIITHLGTLLDTDIRIGKGELMSFDAVKGFELNANIKNSEDAATFLENGLNYVITYFEGILPQDMDKKDLHFFYEDENRSYNHLLIELLEHLSLHKGILFSYLRQLGYNASMGTYYGYKPASKE